MKVSSKKISLADVKAALLDSRFRTTLPEELMPEVQKFLNNPGCACNHPIYRKVLQTAKKQLSDYYPDKEAPPEELLKNDIAMKNDWEVVNCHIDELQDRLRKLRPGRKQLDIARYQDEVTVVINHLDF